MSHVHYYRVKARTHFELGVQLARLFKGPSLEIYHDTLKKTTINKNLLSLSAAYLKVTEECFPHYIEELRGYAHELEVDFSTYWITFLSEELDTYPEKCTSCFSHDGMIIGHNEDFYGYYKDKIALVEKSVGDMNFLELYYYNSLGGTACGVNSNGYVQTINTLHHADSQIGIPRNIIARWLSETKNPKGDFKKMEKLQLSMGYSHTFGNIKGEVINIETTGSASRLTNSVLPYVHTNHYLTDLSVFEKITGPSNTVERYTQASKLISSVKTAEEMMNLLENVSCLLSNKERECDTIARMVFDLKNKVVWCWLERESPKGWIKYPIRFL